MFGKRKKTLRDITDPLQLIEQELIKYREGLHSQSEKIQDKIFDLEQEASRVDGEIYVSAIVLNKIREALKAIDE